MCWPTADGTNGMKTRRKLFGAMVFHKMSHRQWESLLGSLNYAAEVVPLIHTVAL